MIDGKEKRTLSSSSLREEGETSLYAPSASSNFFPFPAPPRNWYPRPPYLAGFAAGQPGHPAMRGDYLRPQPWQPGMPVVLQPSIFLSGTRGPYPHFPFLAAQAMPPFGPYAWAPFCPPPQGFIAPPTPSPVPAPETIEEPRKLVQAQIFRLLLRGLRAETTETEVRQALSACGEVREVQLFPPMEEGRVAVVELPSAEALQRALETHDELRESGALQPFSEQGLKVALGESSPPAQPREIARLLENPRLLKARLSALIAEHPLGALAHTIRVREVWLGGLPPALSEGELRRQLVPYGEVDNVDLFDKGQIFAFARFLRAAAAQACLDDQEGLSRRLGCALRLAFSDPLKRFNLVGDDPVLPSDEELPVLFIGLCAGQPLPGAAELRRKLAEFGAVRELLFRPAAGDALRPFLLAEMESLEQARRARRFFSVEDRDGRRRLRFGDKKTEVSLLLRPRFASDVAELMQPHVDSCFSHEKPLDEEIVELNRPLEPFWTGFLSHGVRCQVGVDAFGVEGAEPLCLTDTVFNLHLSHKCALSELQPMLPEGVVLLRASDEVHAEKFAQLRERLVENSTAGIVTQLERAVGLLLPLSEFVLTVAPRAGPDDLALLFYGEVNRSLLSHVSFRPFHEA